MSPLLLAPHLFIMLLPKTNFSKGLCSFLSPLEHEIHLQKNALENPQVHSLHSWVTTTSPPHARSNKEQTENMTRRTSCPPPRGPLFHPVSISSPPLSPIYPPNRGSPVACLFVPSPAPPPATRSLDLLPSLLPVAPVLSCLFSSPPLKFLSPPLFSPWIQVPAAFTLKWKPFWKFSDLDCHAGAPILVPFPVVWTEGTSKQCKSVPVWRHHRWPTGFILTGLILAVKHCFSSFSVS